MKTAPVADTPAVTPPVTPVATPTAPPAGGTAKLDLSKAGEGFAMLMEAPAGATVKEDFGDAKVSAGDKFQIEIHTGKADIAARKKEIQDNKLNKVKQFITDTADTLLYQSAVMADQPEFHFLTNVTVGDKTYNCEDSKGPTYSRPEAEAMLKAAQSMTAKP